MASDASQKILASDAKVLVVEDEADDQRLVLRALKKLGIVNIRIAANLAEAIRAIQELIPTIIVLDRSFPYDEDGPADELGAARLLRKLNDDLSNPHLRLTKILMHSTEVREPQDPTAPDDSLTQPERNYRYFLEFAKGGGTEIIGAITKGMPDLTELQGKLSAIVDFEK